MKRTMLAGLIAMAAGAAHVRPDADALALEVLQKSIAFRTVQGAGQVPAYAEYLKGVLVEGGYDAGDVTITPLGETATLVARYRGTDSARKPILLLGHMDVVEAKREDWERDPFVPVVEDGFVFGRGAMDNKGDVSILVAALIALKQEGWVPAADLVLALSGDEETGMLTTAELASSLRGAELALNTDGGGGAFDKDGHAQVYSLQLAEKTYADFTLVATDAGGHSSRPTAGNPIYRLAAALERLASYRFPHVKSELTSAYFRASAPVNPGQVGDAMKRYAQDPDDADALAVLDADRENAPRLRTTCVATMLAGGHAPNALPQRASATVNCRILPGTSIEQARQMLADAIAEPSITVTRIPSGGMESPASPLRQDVLDAVTAAVHARYPGIPVVPSMSFGASDGMHFRAQGVPTYGVAASFVKASDDFSHGLNERFPIENLAGGVRQWQQVLRELAD
jgi:carboxypeptidase PM20D1